MIPESDAIRLSKRITKVNRRLDKLEGEIKKKQFEDMILERAEECRNSIKNGTALKFNSAKETIEYLNTETNPNN